MKKAIRWGMLSTAKINNRLAPGIRESPYTELVAVASRERSRAENAARLLGAQKAFGSYEGMLASDEIDAVYISLPNSLHAEWIVKAAEAGKHVLCEKPLASDSKEAEWVVDVCERAGIILMEAFMYRHHPQQLRVMEIISNGRIGKPLAVNARFSYYLEPSEDIRWRGELGGGALMDIGCYCVNASRLILGAEPTTSRGIWRYNEKRGVDETTLAILEFPRGQHASIICSMLMQRACKYEVIGTEGSIDLPNAFRPEREDIVIRISNDSGTEEEVVPGIDQYMLEVEHFSKCILDDSPLKYPAENGLKNMRAIDLVRNGIKQRFEL